MPREYPIQDFLRNGNSSGREEEAHIILEAQYTRKHYALKCALPSCRVKNPPEHLDQERQDFVKINNVGIQILLIASHRLSALRERSKMRPYVIIDNPLLFHKHGFKKAVYEDKEAPRTRAHVSALCSNGKSIYAQKMSQRSSSS